MKQALSIHICVVKGALPLAVLCGLVGLCHTTYAQPGVADKEGHLRVEIAQPLARLSENDAKTLKGAADGIIELVIKAPNAPDQEAAIRMFTISPEKPIVIPYFSNFAGIGLVGAWERLRDPRYLNAAVSYANWYEKMRNPDGTIFNMELSGGKWQKTDRINGIFVDSTDATAGTHLEFLMRLVIALESQNKGSGIEFLRSHESAIQGDLASIKLTLQPDGLTEARPGYNIKYVMDNTETLKGSRSAQWMSKQLGNELLEKEARVLSDEMEKGINTLLWDDQLDVYKWHLGAAQGETDVDKGVFYPMVMSNAMAVAWLPSSERKSTPYAKVKARLQEMTQTKTRDADYWDRVVWLGLAAQGMDDKETLAQVNEELTKFNPLMISWFRLHLDAHVCRIVAGDPITTILAELK